MLKRINIRNFRGIREGEITELSRLSILIGPNGSGKSALIEACYVGGYRFPTIAVGYITQRRRHTYNGAQWVIFGGGQPGKPARIEIEWKDTQCVVRRVYWDRFLANPEAFKPLTDRLNERRAPWPYSCFRIYREHPPPQQPNEQITPPLDGMNDSVASVTVIAANNDFEFLEGERDLQRPNVRLVESSQTEALHDLFSRVVQTGRRKEIEEIVRAVIPDLQGIEILTDGGEPRLFLTYSGHAVPASLGGDGIQALLRTLFQLASPDKGTVLLEEPEAHQHPRTLWSEVKAIVEAVRIGVQVIITTHSLELIDLILNELTSEEKSSTEFVTVRKVRLDDGVLNTLRLSGSDADLARSSLAEDLR